MPTSTTLEELAYLIGGDLQGDGKITISGVFPIEYAGHGHLTWLTSANHEKRLHESEASAVITTAKLDYGNKAAIICKHPDQGLATVLKHFEPSRCHPDTGIDTRASVEEHVSLGENIAIGAGAVIQKGVKIGNNSIIHANCFVGQDSTLGDNCILWPNVVILERCQLGNRVIVHSNTTIGADGFGYNSVAGKFQKIPHIGSVRIEDDVEIGAGSCIDRAQCHETVIGQGTKIDNLVQVAHNVQIGANCCLCSQVGIAGSTHLGDNVMLGGKVGVKDNISIGSRVKVFAYSAVAGNIPDDSTCLGIPAESQASSFERMKAIRQLPSILRKVRDLFQRVIHLENELHRPQQRNGKR